MKTYNIAVLVGSLRKGSFNRRLAHALVRLGPPDFSFNFVRIDDLPLYNQDYDNNPVATVARFKSEIKSARGVLFVTPEYNRSVPGVLKNAIDTGSRPPRENVWAGKPAGIIGISTGLIRTAAGQQHLRNILTFVDMPTLQQPEAFLQMVEGLFDEEDNIGPASREFLQNWMDHFAAWVRKFADD